MKTVKGFQRLKLSNQAISMVTCYDFTSARIVSGSKIDAILVGDSAAMVMHGYESTVHADVAMMAAHVAAVRKGAPDMFLVADMPFLAHRGSIDRTMAAVGQLMMSGAQAVKIEGFDPDAPVIRHIVRSGVPVMGHLGLTPQSIHQLGGHTIQGTDPRVEEQLVADAKALEQAGCFAVVLEMVPAVLAQRITHEISIPTIGIGAGPGTSGQILVFQDLLGMDPDFNPTFLRKFLSGFEQIQTALNTYTEAVKSGSFPNQEESF